MLGTPGVGVPRRFGVGVILLLTLGFAVMYTLTKWLGAPLPVVLLLAGFFVALGIGQASLFGGRAPREASMWVGFLYCPIAIVIFGATVRRPDEGLACAFIGMLVLGPLFGYLFGGLLAGLFLTPGTHPGVEPIATHPLAMQPQLIRNDHPPVLPPGASQGSPADTE